MTDQTTPMPDERAFQADAWLIITMRGLRSFAYGLLAVLLGVALSNAGFSPAAIGILITVSLIGDFLGTYVIGLFADQWGRRRTLLILALLMAATGLVFALTRIYSVLLIAAFFGTLGSTASETAPFLPIDQAMLPQTCLPEQRTALFARYNLVASFAGALGALVAGFPDLLARAGVAAAVGMRLMFGVYATLAFVVALLVTRLSPGVEVLHPKEGNRNAGIPVLQTGFHKGPHRSQHHPRTYGHWLLPPLGSARNMVLSLAGLFSVDALAGGLIVQSLLVLYFHLRFGVPLVPLAALFFAANALSALSFLAAAPLARRFGLLNTMVFTHLPSNILLILVAVMPTFPLAALFLLMRQGLSQMDVPTRQAYSMALVAPEVRTATASVTSLARSAGSATSPVFSGLLLQGPALMLGLPLVLAGVLKAAYDLTLWAIFRRVRLKDM